MQTAADFGLLSWYVSILDKHVILRADIDLAGEYLYPVGDLGPFTGVFDGSDHVIRNAVVDQPGSDYVGLFRYLGSGGQIRDLGVEDLNITGRDDVGGLVGWNAGMLTCCYATGQVTGTGDYVGGLVGDNNGRITSCYATGQVTGAHGNVDGLVGINNDPITGCFWDIETSGQTSSDGGQSRTTAQMKTLSTFTDYGWDFVDTWWMPSGDYPRLIGTGETSHVDPMGYFFSQRDPRWKDDPVGVSGATVGEIGCAMTSVAMVLKFYGIETDPGLLNAWLSTYDGYTADGRIYWTKTNEYSGTTVQYMPELSWKSTNIATDNDLWANLKSLLDQGYRVIVMVDGNRTTPALDTHLVLVTEFLGGDFTLPENYAINDPWVYPYQPRSLGYYNTFFAMWVFSGNVSASGSVDAPKGLTALPMSDNSIALEWQAVPYATSYRLERQVGSQGTWLYLATLAADATNYQDTGLSSDTTHYYRLAAYGDLGLSPYSRTVWGSLLYATMPRIMGIDPARPTATGRPQAFTIYGKNFHPEQVSVTLRHTNSGTEYSNREIIHNTETSITINPNFGSTGGQWSVEVINSDEVSSGEWHFEVLSGPQIPDDPAVDIQLKLFDWEKFKESFEMNLKTGFGTRTLPQIVGLDETQNYGEEDQEYVQNHLESKVFIHETGIKLLLCLIENDPNMRLSSQQHRRWVAYMLATTRQETARTWWPIQELGPLQRNWWYYFEYEAGDPPGYGGRLGNADLGEGEGFRYRGRGYVQITGKDNYTNFSFPPPTDGFNHYLNELLARLGMDTRNELYLNKDPNLALEPEVAYAIMSYGMRKGKFRAGHSLEEYIPQDADPDYYGAREIVNGYKERVEEGETRDIGTKLKDWAEQLYNVLEDSLPRVQNGTFLNGSLAGWSSGGTGSVVTLPQNMLAADYSFAMNKQVDTLSDSEPNNSYWAQLTTDGPVVLYQVISTPDGSFELSFDYQFLTTTGTLDVLLDSVVLGSIHAPAASAGVPSSFRLIVNDAMLFGLEDAVLAFRFDGPTDSQILLSNVGCFGRLGSPLRGDLNLDGRLDMVDLRLFGMDWLQQDCAAPDWCSVSDLDRSGSVDFADFAILASNWR